MVLQNHNFKKSQYERPNQDWVCGWSKDGWSCPIGPRLNGSCREPSECFPIRKEDRWFCTRPELRGGPCQAGPLPEGKCSTPIPKCQPIRSLRKRRGQVSFWTVVATLGLLFFLLPFPNGPTFISPGPVNSVHGAFGEKCDRCHGNSLYSHQDVMFESDSQRCLTCHQFGSHEMEVHNQSPGKLRVLTREVKSRSNLPVPPLALRILNWLPSGLLEPSQPNACGTCHQEHRGKTANLQEMNNQACQVCHTTKFSSFTEGHPALGPYPYKRRTRIGFDHNSHIDKYFQEKDKANHFSSCESCHGLDQANQTMLTANFDTGCAECHTQELKGIGNESSLIFFRLPEIDYQVLTKKRIGDWPEDLKGDLALEQEMTPFMLLLLEAHSFSDPQLAKQQFGILENDLNIIQNFGHLYNLTQADQKILDATERIVWAIKKLLLDLSIEGQQAIISRLEGEVIKTGLGRTLSQKELKSLAAQLPIGVMQTAQKKWIPNLKKEIEERNARLKMGGVNQIQPVQVSRGSLAVNISNTTIDGSPSSQQEEDDSSQSNEEAKPNDDLEEIVRNNKIDDEIHEEEFMGADMTDHVPSSNPTSPESEIVLKDIDGDYILGEDEATEFFANTEDGNNFESENFNELEIGDLDTEELTESRLRGSGSNLDSEPLDPEEIQAMDKKQESGVLLGGWFHSNGDYSIKFKRAGHQDSFTFAWLNLAKLLPEESGLTSGERLMSHFADGYRVGSCLRCHSVDQDRGGKDQIIKQTINWKTFRPTSHEQPGTFFNHGSHLSLVTKEKKCQTCHMRKENQEKDWANIWFGQTMNPSQYSSNFQPLPKETCSTCHRKDLAGENCLLCHNYHIGQFSVKAMNLSNFADQKK